MPDDFTRLLWVLLPLHLDRDGRSLDNASLVKAGTMPLREDVTTEMIGCALNWFADHGMIERYQAEGRSYFWAPTFARYQGNTRKEAQSDYPPPPDLLQTYSGPTPDLVQTYSSTDSDSDSDSDSEAEEETRGASAPSQFADWLKRLGAESNRAAVIMDMHTVLYPNNELPEFGRIGAAAKQIGGWSRLAQLMWEHSTRPPVGRVLDFLTKVAKNNARNDANGARASPAVIVPAPENLYNPLDYPNAK